MGINDLPPNSTFGLEFNYAVWEANTTVTLAKVPWDGSYKDVYAADDRAELDAFIDGQAGPVYTNMSYVRANEPIRVDMPFNSVYLYNYLRVSQPIQPIEGDRVKTFYYFISDVRYIAPNTTEIVVQLDVWQTFSRQIAMGNCYIERGHIGIANTLNFRNNGKDYLTIPEGLDLGGEYDIVNRYDYKIADSRVGFAESAGVVIMSTVSWSGSGGTVDAPILKSARGGSFNGLPNGADLYYFDNIGDYRNAMGAMTDYPWITQGIISVTLVPKIDPSGLSAPSTSSFGVTYRALHNEDDVVKSITVKANWRDDGILPDRYSNLKKFLTYPYTIVELTTLSGNPLILKPESMPGNDIAVNMYKSVAPPNARVAFTPARYNARNGNGLGEDLDMQTGIMNFPTFSIANNSYISFLASNANSLAYQHSSADWSQSRALQGSAMSADVAHNAATSGYDLNQRSIAGANQMNALNVETAGYKAIQSGVNSVAGGLMSGNPMGIVGGAIGAANSAVGYAIDTNQMNRANAIGNSQSGDIAAMGYNSTVYGIDSNNAYAQYAAKGDYANAIAGINAKVQDAKLTQPTTSGQVGGDAFNIAVRKMWSLVAIVKTVNPSAMNAIGEYWLRYGYAVNRFGRIPPGFQVMSKFTYWKTLETYIYAAGCPEAFKQTLRGIFEKGVTVWDNPLDIGIVDTATNVPLEGITL